MQSMSSVDTPNSYDAAINAYRIGEFDRAKSLMTAVIEREPESAEGVTLRQLRARAYETGKFSDGIDLGKASEDYLHLEKFADTIGSDVLAGRARVLFKIDSTKNNHEIQRLCQAAINLDKNVNAKMIFGQLNEDVLLDGRVARRWYLSAYMGGLPWGLRYFADSHAKDGNIVRAMIFGLLATITSPFIVLVKGIRWPFH